MATQLQKKRGKNNMILEILGTIGIGKSTILEQMDDTKFLKVHEPVKENPYLSAFYAELEYVKHARAAGFSVPTVTTPFLEIWMAAQRSVSIQHAIQTRGNRAVVTDFGWPSVFARILFDDGVISRLHYETFKVVDAAMPEYGSILVLLTGYQVAYERMRKRGRDCEKNLTLEYLKRLEVEYLKEMDFLRAKGKKVIVMPVIDDTGKMLEVIDRLRNS